MCTGTVNESFVKTSVNTAMTLCFYSDTPLKYWCADTLWQLVLIIERFDHACMIAYSFAQLLADCCNSGMFDELIKLLLL